VNAEFNWWLLIVGLVIGAALVWLVLADSSRRESEITEEELPKEAAWIAELVTRSGRRLDPETAESVLRLHRTYLASLPPDDDEDESLDGPEPDWADAPEATHTPQIADSAAGHHPDVERDRPKTHPPE
jgi:hypothetical protein